MPSGLCPSSASFSTGLTPVSGWQDGCQWLRADVFPALGGCASLQRSYPEPQECVSLALFGSCAHLEPIMGALISEINSPTPESGGGDGPQKKAGNCFQKRNVCWAGRHNQYGWPCSFPSLLWYLPGRYLPSQLLLGSDPNLHVQSL